MRVSPKVRGGGVVTVPEGQHLCHPRDLAIYDGWWPRQVSSLRPSCPISLLASSCRKPHTENLARGPSCGQDIVSRSSGEGGPGKRVGQSGSGISSLTTLLKVICNSYKCACVTRRCPITWGWMVGGWDAEGLGHESGASILSGKGEAFSYPCVLAEGAFLPHRIWMFFFSFGFPNSFMGWLERVAFHWAGRIWNWNCLCRLAAFIWTANFYVLAFIPRTSSLLPRWPSKLMSVWKAFRPIAPSFNTGLVIKASTIKQQ